MVVSRLDGVEQLLVLYPYVVEGGFTVVSKTPATGNYDAHFGMVLTEEPHVCTRGYEGTDRRTPQDGENRPMNEAARCTEPASESNARGSPARTARGRVVRRPRLRRTTPAPATSPGVKPRHAGWSRP